MYISLNTGLVTLKFS